MLPVLFFTNTKLLKNLYIFCNNAYFLYFYIYGNYSLNDNKQKLETIDEKFNIKVVSPNFKLEYGLRY